MIKLTIEQSFDFYLTSLERCGLHILNLTNGEIEYQIFEEFNSDIPGSLSLYTLNKLELAGIIDNEIKLLSKELQENFFKMKGVDLLWNVDALKVTFEWKEILQLSDKIKELIYQKWSDEEIRQLRGNK